jgi:tRNA wybutosine-synthesizing protein 3
MKTKEETRFEMVKERHKKTFLEAVKKGKADKKIVPLCRHISKTKNYFTSSSCAGRIVLLDVGKEGNKKEAAFHSKWHRKVKLKEVMEEIKRKQKEEELWFKLDPFILHLGTNKLKNAKKILMQARKAGIKRAGIMTAEEGKFIVELIGTQSISLPVKIKEKILIREEYLKQIIEKANQKLEKNYLQLKKFEENVKRELK